MSQNGVTLRDEIAILDTGERWIKTSQNPEATTLELLCYFIIDLVWIIPPADLLNQP